MILSGDESKKLYCKSCRLAALPFVGALTTLGNSNPTKALPSTFDPMTMYADKYQIFTPAEIAKRWNYVSHPSFLVGDTGYIVKTYRLTLILREGLLGTDYGRRGAQQIASTQINRLGLTHVYWVGFGDSPIAFSDYKEQPCYAAFVRGAIVKL